MLLSKEGTVTSRSVKSACSIVKSVVCKCLDKSSVEVLSHCKRFDHDRETMRELLKVHKRDERLF